MVSTYIVYLSRPSYPLDYWKYTVFFNDGAQTVLTSHPATPDGPFLGRVLATSIAPPHNLDSGRSIKCCCKPDEAHDIDDLPIFPYLLCLGMFSFYIPVVSIMFPYRYNHHIVIMYPRL